MACVPHIDSDHGSDAVGKFSLPASSAAAVSSPTGKSSSGSSSSRSRASMQAQLAAARVKLKRSEKELAEAEIQELEAMMNLDDVTNASSESNHGASSPKRMRLIPGCSSSMPFVSHDVPIVSPIPGKPNIC